MRKDGIRRKRDLNMRTQKQKKLTIKRIILKKTGGLCAKCGKSLTLEKTTIDHLIPKYRGGTDELSNLIPMCKHCNKQKGSRIVEEGELTYLEPFYSSENISELKKRIEDIEAGRNMHEQDLIEVD